MRLAWKIALPVACLAVICGVIALVLVHQHSMEQQKLAEEAQAYRVRAEKGEAEAQYSLGRMYFHGQGVPQSYPEALKWYRKAADQNLAKAQYNVGYSYYYGYGTDGDFTEALRWFHLAADQRSPGAENEIGIAYEVGNGVTRDYGEAVRWYRLSAEQGYAAAQYNLGWMYANGRGVKKDRVEARELVAKAADQGCRPAKQMLGRSWPALSTSEKARLALGLAGGIFLLFPSQMLNLEAQRQIRSLVRTQGVLLIFSVALSLFSYAYAGILQPPWVVDAFSLASNFVWGALIAPLPRMVWRDSPKWTLWASGFLLIALNALVLAIFNRHRIDAAIRFVPTAIGLPLGLGITSAVLLLRNRRGGETGERSSPDETAGTEDGELAHP